MNVRVILVCFITIVLVYFVGTKTLITKIHEQNNKKSELTTKIAKTNEAVEDRKSVV